MTTPNLPEPLLTVPHVTNAEFLASPTWLDAQDLIPSGNTNQQANELANTLLKASAWANRIAEQPLQAHQVIWQERCPVDKYGNIYITPPHTPVRSVTALAYGSNFQLFDPTNVLTGSQLQAQAWVEQQSTIIVSQVPNGASYLGSLQFGGTRAGADWVYAQYAYVAGYCSTYLTAAASSGTNALTVFDPTGLQAPITGGLVGTIPGSVMRIWDPVNTAGSTGGEEAVQVANGWNGSNPVSLSSNLANNHAIGAGVSEFPPEIHQAVIQLAVGLLMREDVSDDEPFGRATSGPTLRESAIGGKAGGLIDNAREILLRYRPKVH